MNYWQVAAGSTEHGRDYREEFLRYGMAFMGKEHFNKAKRVEPGDRVILKNGRSEITAVGVVVTRDKVHLGNALEEKDKTKYWLRDFDGWDLPLYIYVDWHKPFKPVTTSGLTRHTIAKVDNPKLIKIADGVFSKSSIQAPVPEPALIDDLSDAQMLKHLIKLGLRPSSADDLTHIMNRIRLLADYYYDNSAWEDIREHETRTFLIIPFLLALGWSEQQLKIELSISGKRVDITCFKKPYKRDDETYEPNNNDCCVIVESKSFRQGLDYAQGQGKLYAKHFSSCQVVVASNGYCYKAYKRKEDKADFEDKPIAYLNLIRPKEKYPRDPSIEGGLTLLKYLIPQNYTVG